jgi:D-sedoheptulose 7-phosphate isomerase
MSQLEQILKEETLMKEAFSSHEALTSLTYEHCGSTILRVASYMIDALENGRKVIFMGNGGSAADAQHLAAELVGRFTRERQGLAAIALTTDTSILTAIANDYGYDQIFSRQVEALAQNGDVVVGISTSGNSPNILKAMEVASERGCILVGFAGNKGGKLYENTDLCITVPSLVTARIQEMHILIGHVLCDIVEEYFSRKD